MLCLDVMTKAKARNWFRLLMLYLRLLIKMKALNFLKYLLKGVNCFEMYNALRNCYNSIQLLSKFPRTCKHKNYWQH